MNQTIHNKNSQLLLGTSSNGDNFKWKEVIEELPKELFIRFAFASQILITKICE